MIRSDCNIWHCCPCCGYPTFTERGGFEICWICNYEDDGLDDSNPDDISGPNGDYTLSEMKFNFNLYGTKYRPNDIRQKNKLSGNISERMNVIIGQYRWSTEPILLSPKEIALINETVA